MSVPIEIENLYGGMDMDGEYLVVRISYKNEKKIGESFKFLYDEKTQGYKSCCYLLIIKI